MATIPLTQNKCATVDEADYAVVSQLKWTATYCKKADKWYAVSGINKRRTYMHRFITEAPRGIQVDHRDMDGLNNSRSNLRLATKAQNMRNSGKRRNNTSGFKGVSFARAQNKWHAQITTNGKNSHLGYFANKLDAAQAYMNASVIQHGEFARV